MIETHIKALTRIKENYERVWHEHLLEEKDVKEEYEAVCAGIEALENLIPQVCSVPQTIMNPDAKEETVCTFGFSKSKRFGGADWVRNHRGVEVMDTPLWVLISLGVLAIEQEDSKDEV